MENNLNLFCSLCERQLKLNKGDYLFTYNTKCENNHENKNIDLDDLFAKNDKKLSYDCKIHSKKIKIHCFDCNKDICLTCYKDSHKNHKMEYLISLGVGLIKQFDLEYIIKREKKILTIFSSELKNFKEKFLSYLDNFESKLNKEIELRQKIMNIILQKNLTYIDIENAQEILSDESFNIINNCINNFCKCKTFIKKYDYMRDIFNKQIIRGKYLETPNLLNIIDKFGENIININKNNFINLKEESKGYYRDIVLKIIKNNSDLYIDEFKYDIMCKINLKEYFKKIIIKNNNQIEKEFTFYYISIDSYLIEVKILNILDNNKRQFIKNNIELDESIKGLIFLEENKNIILNDSGRISLYDNSFNKIKILESMEINRYFYFFESYLKINKNTFVFSNRRPDIVYVAVIDFNNELTKFIIPKCGFIFIKYLEKKKLLVSHDKEFIYLTNFNTIYPEVIQKIEINLIHKTNYANENDSFIEINNIYNYFNDESIYIKLYRESYKNDSFKDTRYIVQYKIDKDELKEVSSIETI